MTLRNAQLFAGAAMLAALNGAVARAEPSPAAVAFGARPAVEDASLSPDGKWIALVQPLKDAQASALVVAPADGSQGLKPILTASGKPERLAGCHWASNTRLVCQLVFTLKTLDGRVGYSRLVAINADGTEVKELTARQSGETIGYAQNGGAVIDWLADGPDGSVLLTRDHAKEATTGTLVGADKDGLAVERVDTVSLARTQVEPPRADAVGYVSDQHGTVRLYGSVKRGGLSGYGKPVEEFYYRTAAGAPWTLLGRYDANTDTGFQPVAVDRDLNAVYGFDRLDGRDALYRIALDGSLARTLVFSHPDVDVDGVIRIGRARRVVGVSYATEKREAVFFDKGLEARAAALSKALPGQPTIAFADASADENRLLLEASGDANPGGYYLFDKTTKSLAEVMPSRPQLEGMTLAQVKPITYRATDGTMVPGYLTLPPGGAGKNLPAIVMPHGGPGSRDEWGFDWLAQFFAHQGYAVLQPNFRGSSGYGQAWFEKNGFQSWRAAVGDINDAGRWLLAQGIAAPGKLAIVGWSYGGYAALQSSVLDPDLFKAIVAIAPVTNLDSLREEHRHYSDYRVVDAFIGNGPHVKEGSPAQNAERIKAPVLMFHGEEDTNVSVAESKLMLSRLKAAGRNADLVVFPGLDHQLDDSAARAQMLDRADAFLRASLGR